MLECLKVKNGYASRNVLKSRQSLLYGVPYSKTTIPTFKYIELEISTPILNASLNFRLLAKDGECMMTKAKILQSQSKNIAIITPKCDFHDYKNTIVVESNPLFMPFL
jgi:hypothetical protein